jgi:predicted nucleic acid-binding protein
VNVSKRNFRVLLDTSFLLPFLGLATDEVVMYSLPKLRGAELFYSELSILEAMWKAVKIVKKEDFGVILEGLRLIRRDLKIARVDDKAVDLALSFYLMGHRDLVDNLLYGIAASQNMKFLTMDEALKRFVKEHGYLDLFISLEDLK